jgi:hypothetical protein
MALEEFIKHLSTVTLEQCAPTNAWAPQDTYFIPENTTRSGGVDCNLYVEGDLPSDKCISANHSHIYLTGRLLRGSKISLRQGFVSAASLNEGAEIAGGIALVISNCDLSRLSKNMKQASPNHPLMLVVPEGKRAEVFDFVTNKYGHDPRYYEGDDQKRMLKEVAQAFPKVPIQIVSWGQTYPLIT